MLKENLSAIHPTSATTQMLLPTPAALKISAADRLSLTLFLAAAAHAVLILGVSFVPGDLANLKPPPTLDIILVQQHDNDRPDEADYLAQTSQTGGGTSEERARPSDLFASTEPSINQGIAPQPMEAGKIKPLTQEQMRVLTQLQAEEKTALTEAMEKTEPTVNEEEKPFEYDLEIARLTAELNQSMDTYAKRPTKLVVSASTHEIVSAQYMQQWVEKIERLGNINYPNEARVKKLEGDLILEVELKWDGSIVAIRLIQSSGHRILDDAAKRVVEMGTPYPPFPPNLRKKADHLQIVRTWQFQQGDLQTH
ncbi:MAG: energy transducer TonB [Gammaproteobacteria bacterium]|nr:energy transducer TonB [Gammaproteobacteria bacterium]